MKTKKTRNNAVGPNVRSAGAKPGVLLPMLGAASIGAGLQAATQTFAHTFGYQAALGPHVGHLYAPWAILRWSAQWYGQHTNEFVAAGSAGVVVSALGLLGVGFAKTIRANTSIPSEYLHGSARWCDKEDIQAAGLLPRDSSMLEIASGADAPTARGVYVGGWVDDDNTFRYLRHDGPEHVLTYAPTRSGKGVGLVIPTLLSWPASCVITDLKGELWELTAGWRHKHAKNKVLRFEPAVREGGVCWNPMDEIRLGTDDEVGDTQNLALMLVDPHGKGLESHWDKTAYALLTGVILHALYKRKNEGTLASLPTVDGMLADPDRAVAELWMEMTTYPHLDGKSHPVVAAAARDMLDRPEEEAGSVLSTAKSHLALYRDPVVAHNVSKSNFRIADLMNHDDPVSLYIVTQPGVKERLRPLVRVLMASIVRILAGKMEFDRVSRAQSLWRKLLVSIGVARPANAEVRAKRTYKHRLLCLLDEFPSMGKIEVLQEALAWCAGYGLKFYLICQDLNQLKSREIGYGPDESITSNCHVQNAYPPGRIETAEHLSRLVGQTTVVKEQITTSGRRMSPLLGQVSRTIQEVQRPLLTPDECMRMPGPVKDGDLIVEPGDMVIYVAGHPAIYGRQPLFFKDPIFAARAAVPAPKVSDKLIEDPHELERVTI